MFLVAGPASNAGTFSMLVRTIGVRAALAALVTISFLLLITGSLVDFFGINLLPAMGPDAHGMHHDLQPSLLAEGLAVLSLLFFAPALFARLRKSLKSRRAAKASNTCCNSQ